MLIATITVYIVQNLIRRSADMGKRRGHQLFPRTSTQPKMPLAEFHHQAQENELWHDMRQAQKVAAAQAECKTLGLNEFGARVEIEKEEIDLFTSVANESIVSENQAKIATKNRSTETVKKRPPMPTFYEQLKKQNIDKRTQTCCHGPNEAALKRRGMNI